MSDLQCPARIFLLRPGAASTGAVAALKRSERVAAVYGSDEAEELEDLADRHRGEAVLVVADHPHDAALVLLELDADGTRVTPWPVPDDERR